VERQKILRRGTINTEDYVKRIVMKSYHYTEEGRCKEKISRHIIRDSMIKETVMVVMT